MSDVAAEIASQPECWEQAARLAGDPAVAAALPAAGERVAVIGCGTSLYMAQALARLREDARHGETDAFPASEFPADRRYDRVVAITRSGTTTEVVDRLVALRDSATTTAITTADDLPVGRPASATVVLAFADERSVVQTRFATSVLALWRAHLSGGIDSIAAAVRDARRLLDQELPPGWLTAARHTCLGTGWTVGLANEAALKLREAAQAWTESYPAMEVRHGPISVLDEQSVIWSFGPLPAPLRRDLAATGAQLVEPDVDPMAVLVLVQRTAVAVAEGRGLDPDRPRGLTRSIVLAEPR